MTDNAGAKKQNYRKNYQYLRSSGALPKRREFIDYDYVKGHKDVTGNLSIRPLNEEETKFLADFTKEYYHASFNTNAKTKKLFHKLNSMIKSDWVVEFYKENGFYPVEIEKSIQEFEEESRALGNVYYKFFDQKDINSDDYKRGFDVQNKASREFRMESYESLYKDVPEIEEDDETFIEDLITKLEE